MAKRRANRIARGAKGRGGGNYQFTYKRKAALYRAAKISAQKRRKQNFMKAAKIGGGVIAVGAGAYLGHRYGGSAVAAVKQYRPGMANIRNQFAAKLAVSPHHKEDIRVASAIHVAEPSATNVMKLHVPGKQTIITEGDRKKAEATMKAIEQEKLPPHMGGPDRRKYDADDNVDTEKMTERSVRATMKGARRRTQGKKAASLTSTPGGTKVPRKAVPSKQNANGMTDEEFKAATAFDVQHKPVLSVKTPNVPKTTTGAKVPAKSKSVTTSEHGKMQPRSKHKDAMPHKKLLEMNKKAQGSVLGHKIAEWDTYNEFGKAILREDWENKGFVVDHGVIEPF